MKKLGVLILIAPLLAVAVAGLSAQDEPAAAKGKGKAASAKGAAKGKGKAAAEAKAPAPPAVPQVLRLMRPSMYLVTGHGDNVVFRDTPEGVILVNSKLGNPGDYERLVELIQGVSRHPVKYVLNSSSRPDATGNNAKFQMAGAAIITGEKTVRLGGIEARTLAFGQTAIYFPADRVIYVGDISPEETAAVWDALFKLDWTLAVPATGEPLYRTAVEARRNAVK